MSTIKGFVQSENIEVRQANGRSVTNFDINVTEGQATKTNRRESTKTGLVGNRCSCVWKYGVLMTRCSR